jgi:MerR family transcriptional regulator, copper efflux regulator
MNIQQAAAASGLSADTIRFYEKRGVLPKPPRRSNGYRDYTDDHVETLRLARGLRGLDVPLADVSPILGVAHDGTCGDLRWTLIERLSSVLSDVDVRLGELRRARRQLTAILEGLREMEPDQARVPGTVACECIQLATQS